MKKRRDEIWEILRTMPPVELKEPYQSGWIVYLDFRDDIKKRFDYAQLKQAFDLVHHPSHTRSLKFIKRVRSSRNIVGISFEREGKDLKWQRFIPVLGLLRGREYELLSPLVKRFFALDSYKEKQAQFRGSYYYLDIPFFWLEIRTKPRIITHAYLKGGPLEKEHDFLEDKIHEYWRLNSHGYTNQFPKDRERAKTRATIQKFKKKEIEDIHLDRYPKDYND